MSDHHVPAPAGPRNPATADTNSRLQGPVAGTIPSPGSPGDSTQPLYGPTAAYPQSAFTYPAAPGGTSNSRSRGKRMALLIAGAVVVGALLFGGGFWAGTAVTAVHGYSDGRFGNDRMGPGGPGDRFPSNETDPDSDPNSDTGTDGSTDSSVFIG